LRRHIQGLFCRSALTFGLAIATPAGAAERVTIGTSAETAPNNEGGNLVATPLGTPVDQNLQALVAAAVSTHPSIAAARASLRASGADLRAAKWLRFPSFSVEGTLLDERNNRRQASAVIDQPIWTAGRVSGAISRASALEQAAVAGYWETVLNIELLVAQSYHEYHRLSLRIDSLSDSLTQHRKLVETMRRRVTQEVSPLSDLDLVESRTSQVEQQVTVTIAQQKTVLQKLRELVDDPLLVPGPPPPIEADLPEINQDLIIDRAVAFDPSRQRLLAEAKAARAEASSTRASVLPQLVGQYSYNETFGHRVGLALKAQSEGGLARVASTNAAKARQQSADLKVAGLERDLRDRVYADFVEYEASRARLASTRQSSESALRVMASYMRQFISGRRTWLDVMNAVREASSAQNDAIDAGSSTRAAYDRLMMRTGSWNGPPDPKEAK